MMVKWLDYIQNGPKGLLIIVGVSKETVYDNILRDLFETLGEKNYHYNQNKGELVIFNRIIKIIGAKDQGSEKFLRGKTLAGAYVDEGTLIPKNFFEQLLNRCSIENSKIFVTTNPDSPYHYLYEDYINNEDKKDIVDVFEFYLDDNPNLSKEYIDFVKSAYSGIFYDRAILGRWIIANGRVYTNFNDKVHVVPTEDRKYTQYYIGSDFGTQNAQVFLLMGKCEDKWYAIKEYYYSGRDNDIQKTPDDYVIDYSKWIGNIEVESIIIDPSATPLKAAFRKYGFYNLTNGKNDLIDGIQCVAQMFNNNTLLINDCCVNLIKELNTYSWDPKKVENGKDTVIAVNDHVCDALRYFVFTILNKGIREVKAISYI